MSQPILYARPGKPDAEGQIPIHCAVKDCGRRLGVVRRNLIWHVILNAESASGHGKRNWPLRSSVPTDEPLVTFVQDGAKPKRTLHTTRPRRKLGKSLMPYAPYVAAGELLPTSACCPRCGRQQNIDKYHILPSK